MRKGGDNVAEREEEQKKSFKEEEYIHTAFNYNPFTAQTRFV